MWRWFFLFLLLANAITLLWFSLQKQPGSEPSAKATLQQHSLRLVSEINPETLKPRKALSDLHYCEEYYGFPDQTAAEQVIRTVQEAGYRAELIKYETRRPVIDLVLHLPEELERRLAVLDYLGQEYQAAIEDQALGAELTLKGLTGPEVTARHRTALRELGVESEQRVRDVVEKSAGMRIFGDIDRNLSNKIKEVVRNRYSLQKNEKKLCEGVAKP